VTASASRESEAKVAQWTPCRVCECCGKFIVLLQVVNPPENRNKWRVCYFKGWDGNPYLVGTGRCLNARPHPKDSLARLMAQKRLGAEGPYEPVDPFFTL
jgi:hypothetical protein